MGNIRASDDEFDARLKPGGPPGSLSSFWFVNEEGSGAWKSECQLLATCTRTPCVAVFDRDEANQTAHIIGRWMSTLNEAGPLSETVSATVPG